MKEGVSLTAEHPSHVHVRGSVTDLVVELVSPEKLLEGGGSEGVFSMKLGRRHWSWTWRECELFTMH